MHSRLLEHFHEQAGFCEAMGSPFTARLIEAMAADLAAGGPVDRLVGRWVGPPRADAVSLRLAGALHAAVLSGRAPELADVYPASRSDWDAAEVWGRARPFLEANGQWVEQFLCLAPQTNEPRRSIALLLGFLDLAARFELPMELLEVGASAGLNLSWDRFSYRTDGWAWGEAGGPRIDTVWTGPPPAVHVRPQILSRAGCDVSPLDVGVPEQRLRLRAYIWPDQADRLVRFDAAVESALSNQVRVERADAAEWLEDRLARRSDDVLTVVYHSVFFQYPSRDTRKRIKSAIEGAGEAGGAPVAWLRMEPEAALGGPRNSSRFVVEVTTWPGPEIRVLGETDGHARFVRAFAV